MALLALVLSLLLLNAWDTTLSDDDITEDVVQLLILTDGSQDVVGDKPLCCLVVLACDGLLEDLLDYLLQDSCHVDRSLAGYSLRVPSFFKVTVDPSNWEYQACAA